ncbi:hypothetical protein ACHAXS_004599, partial [Conticribra weissflogii]
RRSSSRNGVEPYVQNLYVYPIKSCAEIDVPSAKVTPRGFQFDRVFQVVVPSVDCSDLGADAAIASDDEEEDAANQRKPSPIATNATWNYCTPRNPAYQKLFHVQPSLVYDTTFLKLTSSQVEKRKHVRTSDFVLLKLNNDEDNNGRGAGKKNEANSAANDDDLVLRCMTAGNDGGEGEGEGENNNNNEKPQLLRDCGDNAAGWLQRATNITNSRLVHVGDSFQRFVKVNPHQQEELPSDDNSNGDTFPVSLADEAPYLLTSQTSLEDLNRRLLLRGKSAVDMRRFRPNIVVGGRDLRPWEEDTWKRIRIRNVEFHVWQRCGRCIMTAIDRDSLERNGCGGEPLATLSTFREREGGQRNFGMHLIPVVEKGDVEGNGSGDGRSSLNILHHVAHKNTFENEDSLKCSLEIKLKFLNTMKSEELSGLGYIHSIETL